MTETTVSLNPERLKHLRARHMPGSLNPECDICFLVAEINRRDAEIANLQKNGEAMVAAAIGDMRREMMRAVEGRMSLRDKLVFGAPGRRICAIPHCDGKRQNASQCHSQGARIRPARSRQDAARNAIPSGLRRCLIARSRLA